MKRLSNSLTFVLLSLSIPTFSTSPFHKAVTHQGSEQNKAFHKNLLQQLAESRTNGTTLITSVSEDSASSTGNDTLVLVGTNSFAAADAALQVYLSSSLPTDPPPSSACANALTASVNCNSTIPLMAVSPLVLGTTEDLANVCTSACAASLQAYRSLVISSCQGYTIQSNNVSYAPTYAVDAIIGPYTTQCLQDPNTHQYCSLFLTSLNSTGGLLALPGSQLCSYCPLKTLNVTLNNPATYSHALANLLSSAITQCGSQWASYNISSTPSAPVITGPGSSFGTNTTNAFSTDCAITGRNVTATSSTTCSQLATQYSVSDNNVLAANPFLDVNCQVQANTILCIPQACHTYAIQLNDTCDSVAQAAGGITGTNITSVQLQSINPELGTYCQLMALRIGQRICLTPNGGFPNVGAVSVGNPSATPTTQAAVPTPTVSGTTSKCGRYYMIKDGDVCNTVVLANYVSLPDFLLMNPEIDANCTNLWLNYYYCVAPFPPLSTITSAPTISQNFSTVTMMSYPISTAGYTPTFATLTMTPAGVPAPTNVAAGTRTVSCGYYYTVSANDTLASIADTFGYVNSTDLISWNPELSNGAALPLGSAICVLFPIGNYTLFSVPPPSNIAANTTTDCAQFYTVVSGDGCGTIAAKFGLTSTQFAILNPGLNAQCTNLVLGLAYCVLPLVPLSQLGTSNSTGPPSNVASGTITAGCTQYYTIVSGDSCSSMESKFNITLPQFITMNPEVNSACTNLALAEAYCVASSNSTSGIPSNVAAGTITAGCTKYYTIVSGDSCSVIETEFSLTLAQFITMNPEINSGCTNLALAEAYCIASSNSTSGIPSNVASGTITAGCTQYYTVVSGDSCSVIETKFSLTLAQFITMNPEINSGCTNLALAEAYCVASSNSTSGIPSNVASGTITAGCTQYYTVVSGDSCFVIETKFSLTLAQFITMNPEINSGCTNLALAEAYCVKSSSTGSGSGPPSNIAIGSFTNCTSYYTVVSGDSCPAIETKSKIAVSDFFRWNPEVNTACSNIQLGVAYCVGGGGNACQKIYTVQSGDFCSKIVSSQGITQAKLAALNPQLDANCDLSVGENLCVG